MSIKDVMLKSFFQEEIYKLKKAMRTEIAESFKKQLLEKDCIIQTKDDLVAELIKENQTLKSNLSAAENTNACDINTNIYPTNMID